MDITKFFDRKKRKPSSQSVDCDDTKRTREESSNSTSTPTSPGDVFEESLKSGDCMIILEKQVKELFLLAQENKEKHIKGESDLTELTKATDWISGKFDDYERERREKDRIIEGFKSEVSDLNSSKKNSLLKTSKISSNARNSTRVEIVAILIHGITETQDKKTDEISSHIVNEHLELELTEKELDRTHRIGNPKSGNKRPRPIIVKFARYNTRRKAFVNKKG